MDFKPKDYNSLSPYFMVKDSQRWAQLLQGVFNAQMLRHYHRPDGSLMHGELRLDDSVIMYSEATDDYPANTFMLHVYVPDVMATWKLAMDNGCTPVQLPSQKPDDEDKRGMFADFAGNMWAIATQISR